MLSSQQRNFAPSSLITTQVPHYCWNVETASQAQSFASGMDAQTSSSCVLIRHPAQSILVNYDVGGRWWLDQPTSYCIPHQTCLRSALAIMQLPHLTHHIHTTFSIFASRTNRSN